MSEYQKIKSLLDELNIPYKETDCEYWKNSIEIPGKEDLIKDLNLYGCKGLDIQMVIGHGFCNMLFTKETERFIGVEAE